MGSKKVLVLQPYPFETGQKVHISEGPRRGDWEVIGLTDRKVRLRCPISNREYEWDRFCYAVEERADIDWPQKD
jgi:hypothetical protein